MRRFAGTAGTAGGRGGTEGTTAAAAAEATNGAGAARYSLADVTPNPSPTSSSSKRLASAVGLYDPHDLSHLPADQIRYYVHYAGHDRRLDEWIGLERLGRRCCAAQAVSTSEVGG